MKSKQPAERTSVTLDGWDVEPLALQPELAGAHYGVVVSHDELLGLDGKRGFFWMVYGTIELIEFERYAWMGKTRYRDFLKTVTVRCIGARYIAAQDDKPERFMLLFRLWGRDAV